MYDRKFEEGQNISEYLPEGTYLVKNNLIMDDGDPYTADYEGYREDLHQFICSI